MKERRPRPRSLGERSAGQLLAAYRLRCREIHALEGEYRAGRLDQEDWSAADWRLRAAAIELLRRLDGLR